MRQLTTAHWDAAYKAIADHPSLCKMTRVSVLIEEIGTAVLNAEQPASAHEAAHDGVHVFNCHRCPVSVKARWQPPDCPECGDPCVVDMTATTPAPNPRVMELIGRYWDLGFTEGKTGINQADAANEVLRKIRDELQMQYVIKGAGHDR